MVRDAKLFYLKDQDYTPIKEFIEFAPDAHYLSENILIISFSKNILTDNKNYIILSTDNKIDKIIEDCYGVEAQINDSIKSELKKNGINSRQLFFGNEMIIDFLITS